MSTEEIKSAVLQVIASIPEGRVATYGQIANMSGCPGHARYVGSILKKLPKDSKLPWHRVINAQGRSSFPVNSASYNRQVKLLEDEGVVFIGDRISLKEYRWK